jgi:hypothetical protein
MPLKANLGILNVIKRIVRGTPGRVNLCLGAKAANIAMRSNGTHTSLFTNIGGFTE